MKKSTKFRSVRLRGGHSKRRKSGRMQPSGKIQKGEWVQVDKTVRNPNTQLKADSIVFLQKVQTQVLKSANLFVELEKLSQQQEKLYKQIEGIDKQIAKLSENAESSFDNLEGSVYDLNNKLEKAQWVVNPDEQGDFTDIGNVICALQDLRFLDYSEAQYSWSRKELKREFDKAQKDATKFIAKAIKTLKATKKPFVYSVPVFKETK